MLPSTVAMASLQNLPLVDCCVITMSAWSRAIHIDLISILSSFSRFAIIEVFFVNGVKCD